MGTRHISNFDVSYVSGGDWFPKPGEYTVSAVFNARDGGIPNQEREAKWSHAEYSRDGGYHAAIDRDAVVRCTPIAVSFFSAPDTYSFEGLLDMAFLNSDKDITAAGWSCWSCVVIVTENIIQKVQAD